MSPRSWPYIDQLDLCMSPRSCSGLRAQNSLSARDRTSRRRRGPARRVVSGTRETCLLTPLRHGNQGASAAKSARHCRADPPFLQDGELEDPFLQRSLLRQKWPLLQCSDSEIVGMLTSAVSIQKQRLTVLAVSIQEQSAESMANIIFGSTRMCLCGTS
jgi:hypothetical protein